MRKIWFVLLMVACDRTPPSVATTPSHPIESEPTPDAGSPQAIPTTDAGASSTADAAASMPAPRIGERDAVRKAVAEANAALDRAYAKSSKRPGAVASPHTGPWVTEQAAHVDGDAKGGWRVTWSSHAPAGFEFEASVTVSPSGETKVTHAEATFAPD